MTLGGGRNLTDDTSWTESEETATKVLFNVVANSSLFEKHLHPRVEGKDLDVNNANLGHLVGAGGFSDIFQIKSDSLLASRIHERSGPDEQQGVYEDVNLRNKKGLGGKRGYGGIRFALHKRVFPNNKEGSESSSPHRNRQQDQSKYVLKRAHKFDVVHASNEQEARRNQSLQFMAGIDLVTESLFLDVMDHPNIIKMIGVSPVPKAYSPNFYIVLERFDDVLTSKLQQWKKEEEDEEASKAAVVLLPRLIRKQQQERERRQQGRLVQRLSVAHQVSSALAYLHSRRVVFRDIKPGNIGINRGGAVVKLFDFGLARELKECERARGRDEGGDCPADQKDGDVYNLEGMTGTLRYMAPEVGKRLPYGLHADIYSFGVLMWQILSLQLPYEDLSRSDHLVRVFGEEGLRPSMSPVNNNSLCPAGLSPLIETCWSADIRSRPTADEICQIISGVNKYIE